MTNDSLNAQVRLQIFDFASRLARASKDAPDAVARRKTMSLVRRIYTKFGFTDRQKQNIILEIIRSGGNTYFELAQETGFPNSQISQALSQLEKRGEIVLFRERTGQMGTPSVKIRPV